MRSLWIALGVCFAVVAVSGATRDRTLFSQAAKPVVIWHGMGDSCCSPASTGALVKAIEDDLGA